ncbi:MAG: tyrosine-type recombinase/integrase [Armatimonadetes bacterium]|nr:tyrosine-type recombinase/integrase [Armatimonadota bacterium]
MVIYTLQNENRLKNGCCCQDQGLIFPSQSGTPLNPSNLRNRILRPALVAAGITKRIRFHDLRGTFTSLLLEAGGDLKAIQDLLGHKSPSLTLRVYAKSNCETRKEAIRKLETLFSENGR